MKRLIFLLLALVASGVFAQPRGPASREPDAPARQPWMQTVQFGQDTVSCGSALNACMGRFDVVPAGKRLIVTHVSIGIKVADPTNLQAFTGPDGATPPFTHLVPMSQGSDEWFTGGGSIWYFVEAGLRPYVYVASAPVGGIGGSGVATFSLSGYFVDVP